MFVCPTPLLLDVKPERSDISLDSSVESLKTTLGSFNSSRFVLAMLAMLTGEHAAVDLSSLLTNGLLGLSQSVIRLAGEPSLSFLLCMSQPISSCGCPYEN